MTDIDSRNLSDSEKKDDPVRFITRLGKWFRSDAFKCVLMDIAAYMIILVVFCFVCVPKKYDLAVNSIAPETIKATKDVTDEVTTRSRREEAAFGIERYTPITEDLLGALDAAFAEMRAARDYVQDLVMAKTIESTDGQTDETASPEDTGDESFTSENEIPIPELTEEVISQAFSEMTVLTLTDEEKLFVLNMSPFDFEEMIVTLSGDKNFRSGIIESLLRDNTFREDSIDRLNEEKYELMEREDLQAYKPILQKLLDLSLKPNFVIDQEATEEARQKAMESVEPVVYLQGRTIIREGEPVYEYQLAMLRTLGLLNDQVTDYSLYYGSAVAVLIAILCLLMSLKLLRADILTDVRKTAVILIILILAVGMAALAHLLPNQFVIPVAMGAILGTVLIGYRVGICLIFTLSILFAALTSGNASSTFFDVVLLMSMTIAESIIAVWFLKGRPQRVRVLLAGPLSALAGILVIFSIRWLTSSESFDIASVIAWALTGGILAGVLAVAIQPALEQLFRLATPSRLLELTNPNQPLMKRLMIEAPGTYHHSIIVANLAEAAADKIQANPFLARAGAYYHDIGKLKRPGYFKENQNIDNPHERTDPYVSAAILISHTTDGVLLAQKEHMPREVQDIILQHHGVTPVMFFYHKALQMSDGSHVDIDEFRYAGPKPKTKEAAIVMLADTIEAAVRSMKDPTPKGIDQFIERLVRGKLEDGQLSESPLSLSDIDQICEAFSGILKGVYHERIEYPNVPHYAGKSVPVSESDKKPVSIQHDEHAASPENGNDSVTAVPEEQVSSSDDNPNESVKETDKPEPKQDAEKDKEDTPNEA